MGEARDTRTVDAIYDQVRAAVGGAPGAELAVALAPIAPGIRVVALRTPTLPPATHTNAYVVGPDAGPVAVIDPGSPYPSVQAALDRALAELPIACVLLTHHHGDHVGGAAALAARSGAPICAHPITAELLAGIVAIDRALGDGEVVEVGGLRIAAHHTPGHARGHLCFRTGDATLAGDMVAGIGTILIDPDEGDMAIYLASLAALLARPPGMLGPAHGPMIADGHAKLREYIAHRTMRETRVLGAVASRAAPATLAELVAIAYADTPPAMWIVAERSLAAHLAKLVAEGRVRQDTGVGAQTRYSAAQ